MSGFPLFCSMKYDNLDNDLFRNIYTCATKYPYYFENY